MTKKKRTKRPGWREALERGAKAFARYSGAAPNVAVIPPATAAALGISEAEANRQAAKILGALGGRAGRGEAKRRSPAKHRRAWKASLGWRRRPGTFYRDGDDRYPAFFYCDARRHLWAIVAFPGGADAVYAPAAGLPRTARIADTASVPVGVRDAASRAERAPAIGLG